MGSKEFCVKFSLYEHEGFSAMAEEPFFYAMSAVFFYPCIASLIPTF